MNGNLVQVVGLFGLGVLALIGSIFTPAPTAIALFTLLGALGGFIAGRMNGMETAAKKAAAEAVRGAERP